MKNVFQSCLEVLCQIHRVKLCVAHAPDCALFLGPAHLPSLAVWSVSGWGPTVRVLVGREPCCLVARLLPLLSMQLCMYDNVWEEPGMGPG